MGKFSSPTLLLSRALPVYSYKIPIGGLVVALWCCVFCPVFGFFVAMRTPSYDSKYSSTRIIHTSRIYHSTLDGCTLLLAPPRVPWYSYCCAYSSRNIQVACRRREQQLLACKGCTMYDTRSRMYFVCSSPKYRHIITTSAKPTVFAVYYNNI